MALRRKYIRTMPDGKADRHILPNNSYRSGLRAGRATERSHAVEAFAKFVVSENLADEGRVGDLKRKFADFLKAEER